MFVIAMLFAGTQLTLAQEKKEVIATDQIPKEISSFVGKHYTGNPIQFAYLDKGNPAYVNYDVTLKDGTELEFNTNFELEEIEGKKGIPASLIHTEIGKYLEKNYPNQEVVEWSVDKADKTQELKLKNNTELIFDLDGKFLSVDK
jgi:hypothetical protein